MLAVSVCRGTSSVRSGCFSAALWILVLLGALGCGRQSREREGADAEVGRVQAALTGDGVLTFEGHDYRFVDDAASFAEAQASCEDWGGYPIAVDSAGEDVFLRAHARKRTWIGAISSEGSGEWRWQHESEPFWAGGQEGAAAPGRYANFAPGEPNERENHGCASIGPNDERWRAMPCVSSARYVCERDGSSAPPAPDVQCTRASRGGHDYWFCDTGRSFAEARERCQGVGMDLATIGDGAENEFVQGNARRPSYLGFSDRATESAWKWLAGRELGWCGDDRGRAPSPGSFASFAPREPSTAHCTLKTQSGRASWSCKDEVSPEVAREACESVSMALVEVDQKGFVCEGVIPDPPIAPDTHDCALISERSGRWDAVQCGQLSGYVCESVDADAYATLDQLARSIRDDYRSGEPRVSDVVMREGTSLEQPFLRDMDRLGLRECVDALEPSGPPRPLATLGLEVIDYQQKYRGVPVHGRGYAVRRDPATGAVRSFTGRVEHGIDLDTKPAISERRALDEVMNGLGASPSDRARLAGLQAELVIFPKTQGKHPTWELAFLFMVPAGPNFRAHAFAISARTGAVLMDRELVMQQCTSEDVTAVSLEKATIDVNTFQQNQWFDPSDAIASRNTAGGTNPYLLFSVGLSSDPTSALFNGPTVVTECAEEDYPRAAGIDMQAIVVDYTTPDGYIGAAFQMAVQRCIEFFARDLELSPGTPWVGLDGAGTQRVVLSMFRDETTRKGPFFDPNDDTINFSPDYFPFMGATIETACHEFAHGVWEHVLGVNEMLDPETMSVGEAFADVFGNAAEMSVRGYPGAGSWCLAGDEKDNASCLRDFASPELSTTSNCEVRSSAGAVLYRQCPRDYLGPDYCTLGACAEGQTTDCCTPHRNSTILSHWSYLTSNGGAGVNDSSCPYELPPMDDELRAAVTKTVRTLLGSIRDQRFAQMSGYEGIADATISTARDTFGADSVEAGTVAKAWFAVNVKENFGEAQSDEIYPPRNLGFVNPWLELRWPLDPDVTEWDVQVSLGPFDDTPILFEGTVPAFEIEDGDFAGTIVGYLQIALPENSTERYFWRVRPHSEEPWADCYPIHSFVGTGEIGTVEELTILDTAAGEEPGTFRPGRIRVGWTEVEGVDHYELTLSTRDIDCERDADSITRDINPVRTISDPENPDLLQVYVTGVQPGEHYFLNLRPVGPNGISGQPALGDCYELEFDTVAMRAPEIDFPNDGQNHFSYHPGQNVSGIVPSDPVWHFDGMDGPSEWRMSFYEIDESGSCDALPVTERTGEFNGGDPCEQTVCPVQFDELVFPSPNPTGYCWDVTAIAKNGAEVSSELRRFLYTHATVDKLAPGIPVGNMVTLGQTSPLPGNSYGSDVDFEWAAEDDAVRYGFKLGLYPWGSASAPGDPANCFVAHGTLESSSCGNPRTVTHREEVTDTRLTLPGTQASQGRYCWTVWPIIAEPGQTSESPRQPLVESFPQYCYTSGPGTPVVDCPPRPPGFSDDPIDCTVTFPYVPDAQFDIEVEGVDPDQYDIDNLCEPEPTSAPFEDFYDCVVDVTIRPREGQSVTIRALAWNDAERPPLMDPGSPVQDVPFTFDTGTCGANTEPCCENDSCDNSALVCQADECVSCGGRGEACCEDEECDVDADCQGGRCVGCGRSGESCCPGGECSGSLACSGGRCVAPRPCDSNVEAGDISGGSFPISVGESSGTTRLSFITYDVPDRLTVRNDRGEVELDVGCVATDAPLYPVPASCPNFVGSSGCCPGQASAGIAYICWRDFSFNSPSGVLTVDIGPNCAGSATGTQWDFLLWCAD